MTCACARCCEGCSGKGVGGILAPPCTAPPRTCRAAVEQAMECVLALKAAAMRHGLQQGWNEFWRGTYKLCVAWGGCWNWGGGASWMAIHGQPPPGLVAGPGCA